MNYLDIFRAHGGVVLLGFLLALLSSFGQTYFIALSAPDIRSAFGLSHGGFGAIFSVATLVSGLLLALIGSALDHVSARFYAALALAGLSVAALGLTYAADAATLGLCVFMLRLCGQGLLSHAAITSTARLPLAVRGRALGFASLGFQSGMAIFPAAGVALIAALGWLTTWRLSAAVCAVFALLLFPFSGRAKPAGAAASAIRRPPRRRPPRRRRRDVVVDPPFLILLPGMLGPPTVSTGYFFHQRFLAEKNGWSLDELALAITATAIASVLSSVGTGTLIDRFGAIRLTRLQLLPLALASLGAAAATGPAGAILFFILVGLTSGASGVVATAALAEIYGAEQLGMIRAVAQAMMVLASAVAPVAMGYAFDFGVGIGPVGFVSAAYLGAASALTLLLAARPLRP